METILRTITGTLLVAIVYEIILHRQKQVTIQKEKVLQSAYDDLYKMVYAEPETQRMMVHGLRERIGKELDEG
jgi:hypothetical protein